MNSSRWFLSLILLGLSSSMAMADSVDPKFVPIGGTGSIILGSPTDPAFTFSYAFGFTQTVDCGQVDGSFSDAGFTCIDPAHTNTEFVNNSGRAWTSLTLEFTGISGDLIFSPTDNANFIDPYFNNSTSGINEAGNPFVTFFGIDEGHPGILAAFGCDGESCSGPTGTFNDHPVLYYDFSILADVTDAQHTGDAFTTRGTATAVPEPPTGLLALGAGLLLFLFKRP